ncbi:MAG: hypothetical protein O7I42_10410 [Alphaproteobacteria bacterium]|nr:hypothetical protein [Alphaproteobacteria bacterium]
MTRRIGKLDTPEQCTEECARVYRKAWKGEVSWPDAQGAAAVLERLSSMIAANGDKEQREAKWSDVGTNAIRR